MQYTDTTKKSCQKKYNDIYTNKKKKTTQQKTEWNKEKLHEEDVKIGCLDGSVG